MVVCNAPLRLTPGTLRFFFGGLQPVFSYFLQTQMFTLFLDDRLHSGSADVRLFDRLIREVRRPSSDGRRVGP